MAGDIKSLVLLVQMCFKCFLCCQTAYTACKHTYLPKCCLSVIKNSELDPNLQWSCRHKERAVCVILLADTQMGQLSNKLSNKRRINNL